MKLRQLINYVKTIKSPLDRDPNIPDDETQDKVLRTLRRQRRTQFEEVEKKVLKKDIDDYNRQKDAYAFSGDGHSVLQSAAHTPFSERPRHRVRSKTRGSGFLDRGGLL